MRFSQKFISIIGFCCILVTLPVNLYSGMNIWTLFSGDVKLEEDVIPNELWEKFDYLTKRGYSLLQENVIVVWEHDELVYNLVYNNINHIEIETNISVFEEDDIDYTCIYARCKLGDPNFYTTASLKFNGKYFRFIKINYLLKYNRIKASLSEEGSIEIRKIFY